MQSGLSNIILIKVPYRNLKSRKTVPDISYIKQTSESMYLKKIKINIYE